MTYPGGKGGAGIAQLIINQMPPHDVYIEPFIGGGSVCRAKRPATSTIVIDADAAAIAPWLALAETDRSMIAIHGDALAWLDAYPWTGRELVYLDPPYLMITRKTKTALYNHELSDADHARLLALVKRLPCMVLLSGYAAPLYVKALRDWRPIAFTAMTRGGQEAVEHLWCNFPAPTVLHDPRYIGRDFRERARIKKKARRWQQRLAALPPLERQAVLSVALADLGDARAASNSARPDPGDRASPAPARGSTVGRENLPAIANLAVSGEP